MTQVAFDKVATDTGSVSFSVVIAAHNRGVAIDVAIDGLRRQVHPPDEILVVDDGSTDDLVARLAPFRDSVRLVRQQRLGRVAARNRGVELARNPWIAFFEFDAPWSDDHLARVARAIDSTHGAAAFYFQDAERSVADGGGSLWRAAGFECDEPHQLVEDASDWSLLRQQPMVLGAAVVRRDAFLAVGGLDQKLPRRHGADLFLKLSLGQAACAVEGLGSRVSVVSEPRDAFLRGDQDSVAYWIATVGMYRAALQRVTGTHRRMDVRHRLAAGHWRLARMHARAGRVLCAGWQFVRSCLVSPSVPLHALHRFWRRRRR